jgi:CRP/FNR family transcriptional regulator, cyclic AMP receptor protein
MNRVELLQIIQSLRFAAELGDATASKLADLLSLRQYSAGKVIFEEGTLNPWLYLLVDGEVALEMCIPARGCTRILTLGPGDLLAWSSVLGGARMTAGAHALTDVRMLVAPAQAIVDLCAVDHSFGFEFFQSVAAALSKRLVATRLQLLDLYSDSPATQAATPL